VSTWLRIRRQSVVGPVRVVDPGGSWFAEGGYASSLYASGLENDDLPHAWKIIVSGLCSDITRRPKVLNVFQAPDSGSPPLPPDVFKDKNGVRHHPGKHCSCKSQVQV
jgi:hypothetical protein